MTDSHVPFQANDAPPNPPGSRENQPPGAEVVRGRFALLIIALMVLLADVCIYHAEGFSGPAAFVIGAIVLMFVGIPRRNISVTTIILTIMLMLTSWRLACNGSSWLVISGLWLIHALVLALRRESPYIIETLMFAAGSVPGGYAFLSAVNKQLREKVLRPVEEGKSGRWIDTGLPAISALLFGTIFIMANPDILNWISGWTGDLFRWVWRFFEQFSPFEIAFWFLVAWVTAGMLRPVVDLIVGGEVDSDAAAWAPAETPMYGAFRNTLLTVITMFSVYLIFEFKTSWSRTYPEGFYYSGYAHQGAAWLTVALALATLMLSLIFRGLTLHDPRLNRLRGLAWIWSGLNFVLAIAVYHRMMIYIDFNGMTRMRVVGILGITSVVGGFVLVIVKIHRGRNFLWLIRRQLWVVAAATFVFAIFPVDSLVHSYNVRQILAGNPAPIVQITEHPIDNEALPILLPLCEVPDERLRNGMQAMMTSRLAQLKTAHSAEAANGWTAWQKSTSHSLSALQEAEPRWQKFASSNSRNEAWQKLKVFAYERWW